MKNIFKVFILGLLCTSAYPQQATEIDSKSVRLPRYADQAAVTLAIPSPAQGMLIYRKDSKTNWYYDGFVWKDMAVSSVSIPNPLYLMSNSTTITGETDQADEAGVMGINTTNGVGNAVLGRATSTKPDEHTVGVKGENMSINSSGFGVLGTHNGTGWAGYFEGYNALKTQGNSFLNGDVGIGTESLIGKLTVKTQSVNWNFPSLLLIDDAIDNNGGAILQFRNPADKRMYLQSNFGTQTDGTDSYLTFSHNAFYNMRLRGDGNLGIGSLNPNLAGLVVNKKVGNSHAIFGDNTSGVSIESNFPGIHFNSYYNGSRKTISTGYTAGAEMNPTTGDFSIYTSPASTTAGSTASVYERLKITKEGSVSVNQNLTINGEIKPSGISGIQGQVLQNNGNGTMNWQTIGSTMGYKKGKMIMTTGASTWTVPANVTEVMVEIWGAGAGSNGIVGGISGHYGRTVMTVTPSSIINFNIGLGGNGGIQDFGVIPGQRSTVTFPGGAFLTVGGGDKYNLDFNFLGTPTTPEPTTNIDNAITHNGNYGEPTVQVFGQKSSTIFTETKYFGIGGIPYGIDYKIPSKASFEYYENGVLIRSAPFPPFSYPACGGMIISSNAGRYGGNGFAIVWWN